MGVFQVRYRFNERPDLELIAYGMERLKEFAQETNYIIHLEYPGITEEELTKEEVGPKLDKKAFRIDLGKTKNWGSKKFFLVKFAISHLQNLK